MTDQQRIEEIKAKLDDYEQHRVDFSTEDMQFLFSTIASLQQEVGERNKTRKDKIYYCHFRDHCWRLVNGEYVSWAGKQGNTPSLRCPNCWLTRVDQQKKSIEQLITERDEAWESADQARAAVGRVRGHLAVEHTRIIEARPEPHNKECAVCKALTDTGGIEIKNKRFIKDDRDYEKDLWKGRGEGE